MDNGFDEELIDGFHYEVIPEFNTDDVYSEDALSWIAGMRAVWILYRKGRWGALSELRVRREDVEDRLSKRHYGEVLTQKQAEWLARLVPEMETASVLLRMRYALKYRIQEAEEQEKKDMNERKNRQQQSEARVYLADVEDALVKDVFDQHVEAVEAAGLSLSFARSFSMLQPAKLRLTIPAGRDDVLPVNVLPGLEWQAVRGVVMRIPENAADLPSVYEEEGE